MARPKDVRDRIRFGAEEPPESSAPPLRLLAIGDFSCGSSARDAGRMRVDKDSFNEALRTVCPRVAIRLGSRSPGSSPVEAEFPVQDLKSFAPAQLAAAPLFRDLVSDRTAAVDLRDGRIRPEEFKHRVQSDVLRDALVGLLHGTSAPPQVERAPEPPRRADPRKDDILDSILGMVEAPAAPETAGPTDGAARVQAFISDMFKGGRPVGGVDRGKAGRMVQDIEGMLVSRLNDVLNHSEFRRLEAAWRGLKFLVDRTDFRDAIELDVVSAPKGELVRIMETELAGIDAGAAGVDAVLAPFEFRNTPEDLDIARRAAELAAALRAPVVISVGAPFFGKESAAEVTRIPHLRAHLDNPGFVKWESFRGVESSRWLGAGFNRFLLRNRYEPASAHLAFPFHETGDGLWGDPVWAIGSLLVRSFSRTSWCGHITGVRGGGVLEDLPVREFALPSGDVRQIPLEAVFLRGREDDFYGAGFLALQCGEDQDVAALMDAPTAHRPEQYSDARETEDSRHRAKLSYQLVAGRIARFVERELAQLGGLGAAEIQREIGAALKRLMGGATDDAVEVRLAESQERVGYHDLVIRVSPGHSIWPLPVALHMNVPLRRN